MPLPHEDDMRVPPTKKEAKREKKEYMKRGATAPKMTKRGKSKRVKGKRSGRGKGKRKATRS
jgi:hypothetical protein